MEESKPYLIERTDSKPYYNHSIQELFKELMEKVMNYHQGNPYNDIPSRIEFEFYVTSKDYYVEARCYRDK